MNYYRGFSLKKKMGERGGEGKGEKKVFWHFPRWKLEKKKFRFALIIFLL